MLKPVPALGRIWLYCKAFVEQALFVEFFQKPPNTFYIFIFIGNIGVFHINPIPHFFSKQFPVFFILQNIFSTLIIILFNAYFLSNIFFLLLIVAFPHLAQREGHEYPIRLFYQRDNLLKI